MQVIALAEVADFLGVSRQRAAILADRPDFPAPLATLSVGRIWSTEDVRSYAARRNRRLDDSGAEECEGAAAVIPPQAGRRRSR